jgi:hypothetical protein
MIAFLKVIINPAKVNSNEIKELIRWIPAWYFCLSLLFMGR